MARTMGEWATHRQAKRPLKAALAARDAMLYALLWDSGLRAGDAIKLNASQFSFLGPAPGLPYGSVSIDVTVFKTSGGKLKNAARVEIPGRAGSHTVTATWKAYSASLDDLDITEEERHGRMFRRITALDDGSHRLGVQVQWSDMADVYSDRVSAMGVPLAKARLITLHSYHGSRAAREKAMGIPKEETCRNMCWSVEMYDYYTEGREPLTLDGILSAAVAGQRA